MFQVRKEEINIKIWRKF